jgi:SAM-dependent methyltransferase
MHKNSIRRRIGKKTRPFSFDKYDLYKKAVQSPDSDVEFYTKVYKELRKKKPKYFREDFCGTFALSCEWVKLNKENIAYGLDIDPEPMEYGRAHYWSKLTEDQKKRVKILERNVLGPALPTVDIAVAMNFSYFCFKSRELLKKYFQNSYKSLKRDGLFIVDTFGGKQCQDAVEDVHKHKGFTYYWDQVSFDPVTGYALFYIHFKVNGQKIQKVFKYDWRMWTIPEIRELLEEAGFKKTHVYWEGTTRKGEGNGIFTRTEKGEACDSWIAYIAAEK